MFEQQVKYNECRFQVKFISYRQLEHYQPLPPGCLMNENQPLPEALFGDSMRLKQVLINLTKDALKFALGRNSLVVIFAGYDQKAEMLRVCVSFNGKADAAQELTKLIDQFNKQTRTASACRNSNGFGLAISKNVV